MLYSKLQDCKDYLFLCCADKTVKILSLESSQVLSTSQEFQSEVIDIKMVNNFDRNNLLIISLKNGELKVLDVSLNFIFDIPSRFSTNGIRYVIGLKKPENIQDDNKGDLLIITEGKNLDIFNWIKPGSFNKKNQTSNPMNDVQMNIQQNQPHNPHQPHHPHQPHQPYYPKNQGSHYPHGNYH